MKYRPGKAVQDFYEAMVDGMQAEDPIQAAMMPTWGDLSSEQVHAWTLAFASTLETGARMGHAIVLTTSP